MIVLNVHAEEKNEQKINVPCGFDANGLTLGVQKIRRYPCNNKYLITRIKKLWKTFYASTIGRENTKGSIVLYQIWH